MPPREAHKGGRLGHLVAEQLLRRALRVVGDATEVVESPGLQGLYCRRHQHAVLDQEVLQSLLQGLDAKRRKAGRGDIPQAVHRVRPAGKRVRQRGILLPVFVRHSPTSAVTSAAARL